MLLLLGSWFSNDSTGMRTDIKVCTDTSLADPAVTSFLFHRSPEQAPGSDLHLSCRTVVRAPVLLTCTRQYEAQGVQGCHTKRPTT